ncbi:putative Secreted Protein [Cryptosporidium felis]|nr:putative Secreted Protein [Cryptosporidium felis]
MVPITNFYSQTSSVNNLGMRIKHLFLITLIFTRVFEVNGSENQNKNEENSSSYSKLEKFISNSNEVGFLLESILKLLINYFLYILKAAVIFDSSILDYEFVFLNSVNRLVNEPSNFFDRSETVNPNKAKLLFKYLMMTGIMEPINILTNTIEEDDVGFILKVGELSSEIVNAIEGIVKLMKFLVTSCSEKTLELAVESILQNVESFITLVRRHSEDIRKSSKMEVKKLYRVKMEHFSTVNFSIVPPNLSPTILVESTARYPDNKELIMGYLKYTETGSTFLTQEQLSDATSYFKKYHSCLGLSDTEVFNIEMLASTAVSIIGVVWKSLLFFEDEEASYELIEKTKNEVHSEICERGTVLWVDFDTRLEVITKVRKELGFEEIQGSTLILLAFKSHLDKRVIVPKMKFIYRSLLNILMVLKSKLHEYLGSPYLSRILNTATSLYEILTKKCSIAIAKCEKLPDDVVVVTQVENISSRRKKMLEQKKKEDELRAKEKQIKKELKEKEKKEKEESVKERLQKMKEEKKSGKKKKQRIFPEVQSKVDETTGSGVEGRETMSGSRSRSRSKGRSEKTDTGQSSVTAPTAQSNKQKTNRKEEKLKKLQLQEEKSELKVRIQRIKQEQKSLQVSEKKRKQEDRKLKKTSEREREEEKRREEMEKKKTEEKMKREKSVFENNLYALRNSIESVEGMFQESEKSANLGSLISAVFGIISESVNSDYDDYEKLIESLSRITIEQGLQDTVSGHTQPVQTRVRRRADEVPTEGGASVPTSQLFESGAVFSTRGRSRSKSRAASRSRSRSRSGSTSRSTPSHSRKTSRSRSKSKSRPRAESSEKLGKTSESKFLPLFEQKVEPKLTDKYSGLDFFQVREMDYSHLTDESDIKSISDAIRECGLEIQRLHLDVGPLLSGAEFLTLKLIQKSLISQFVRLLILLNNLNEKSD